MTNSLQSSLQRALDGLQDALNVLHSADPNEYPHQTDDMKLLNKALTRVLIVAQFNRVKFVEKESL